ncbi:MAG: T9SS type A sorting domain-containing protein [Flavobacteriaceae bacterium]
MKKIVLLIALFSGFSMYSQEYKQMMESGNFTVSQVQQKAEEYFNGRDKGRGSGYNQYKRWEYFALKQQDENGFLKDPTYLFSEWNRYSRIQNNRNQNRTTSLNDDWSEVGPTYWNGTSGWNPGVGRISGFAVDKSDQNHIIVGSIGGGIWKTTNGGTNWQPLTDNHGNMYAYSLAVDPNNTSTYYWGSSGGRIYKSTNSGTIWNAITNVGGGNVLKILIHPTNSNVLFATVQNTGGGNGGLYKSTDAGVNWTRVITQSMYDVEFDPNDSSIIFASGFSFYRSTDTGDNFTQINGVGSGVKMIGVSKDDSNRVYLVEEKSGNSGAFEAFYRSTDNGLNFGKVDHGNTNFFGYESDGSDALGQAPRDMGITVSPTDADEVHIAGINSWRSTNGGFDFSITSQWVPGNAEAQDIGYCHADIDDIEFVGGNLYVISDGGIFICENSTIVSKDYYRDLTSGLGIRQFYLMGVSQTDPVVISAGAQDNGASVLRNDGTWADWLGADGFECIVDVNNSDILYGTIYNGNLYKSTNQGTSVFTIPRPESTGWVTPLEQDATGNLYFGGSEVYKSEDGGNTWVSKSQNFGNWTDQVKIAPSDNVVIYASVGSNLYKASRGGENGELWDQLTGFSGSINSIAVHPTDPDKVAIAVTGSSEKVYVTSNGGTSWDGYSANLPNFTAFALVWDNNGKDGLYLGMNYGVYYIDNDLTEWNLFNNNLPNVRITELEINYADNNLYASSYGRGIWKSPRSSGVLSVENHILESLKIYPNPTDNELKIVWDRADNVSVRMFNISGQLIYYNRETSLVTPLEINTSKLASGVYFLKVSSSSGSYTKKVIVN